MIKKMISILANVAFIHLAYLGFNTDNPLTGAYNICVLLIVIDIIAALFGVIVTIIDGKPTNRNLPGWLNLIFTVPLCIIIAWSGSIFLATVLFVSYILQEACHNVRSTNA